MHTQQLSRLAQLSPILLIHLRLICLLIPALVLSGCAGALTGVPAIGRDCPPGCPNAKVIPDPRPEWVNAFTPADRCGVLHRHIASLEMRRLVYVPKSLVSDQVKREEVLPALLVIRMSLRGFQPQGDYKEVRLEVGGGGTYGEGRRKSPFHQPVRTKLDGRDCWVIMDRVHSFEDGGLVCYSTLEIYASDPTAPGTKPTAVWIIGKNAGSQTAPWELFPGGGPFPVGQAFYKISEIELARDDGHLAAVTLAPWTCSLDDILAVASSDDLLTSPFLREAEGCRLALETLMNDTLIHWKSEGLPETLQSFSGARLKDLAVQLEKAVLKLDLKAKELKNLADEDARQAALPGEKAQKKAPPGALSSAHLLDQRKTIMMVILGSVKKAAAQKGGY